MCRFTEFVSLFSVLDSGKPFVSTGAKEGRFQSDTSDE